MIMLGISNMGRIPFHTIYLHGLVLDPEGVKMSKTKGNVLNPLDLIDEYGADAVRFALTTGTSAGNNLRMNEQKLESSRNFANKLWNASRFVISNLNKREDSIKTVKPENILKSVVPSKNKLKKIKKQLQNEIKKYHEKQNKKEQKNHNPKT